MNPSTNNSSRLVDGLNHEDSEIPDRALLQESSRSSSFKRSYKQSFRMDSFDSIDYRFDPSNNYGDDSEGEKFKSCETLEKMINCLQVNNPDNNSAKSKRRMSKTLSRELFPCCCERSDDNECNHETGHSNSSLKSLKRAKTYNDLVMLESTELLNSMDFGAIFL